MGGKPVALLLHRAVDEQHHERVAGSGRLGVVGGVMKRFRTDAIRHGRLRPLPSPVSSTKPYLASVCRCQDMFPGAVIQQLGRARRGELALAPEQVEQREPRRVRQRPHRAGVADLASLAGHVLWSLVARSLRSA